MSIATKPTNGKHPDPKAALNGKGKSPLFNAPKVAFPPKTDIQKPTEVEGLRTIQPLDAKPEGHVQIKDEEKPAEQKPNAPLGIEAVLAKVSQLNVLAEHRFKSFEAASKLKEFRPESSVSQTTIVITDASNHKFATTNSELIGKILSIALAYTEEKQALFEAEMTALAA